MPRPKKNVEVKEEILPPEGTGVAPVIAPTKDVRAELISLLQRKTPGIFDREPSPGFNGHLPKLADEIISLFN